MEAKSYSYDGDDWGEADEYDEYGNYDGTQPEPQEPSRPTGLRQQGQSALAGVPGQLQHGRNNSFDEGQERRQFSTGAPLEQQEVSGPRSRPGEQPQPGYQPDYASADGRFSPPHMNSDPSAFGQQAQRGTPSGYSQVPPAFDGPAGQLQNQPGRPSFDGHVGPPSSSSVGPPHYRQARPSLENQQRPMHPGYPPPGNYRGGSYSNVSQGTGSRTQSMTSNTSSLDFQGRRDFSPTAMPPPLSTRGSPAPSNMLHPPRKSSLSQVNSPSDFTTPPQDFYPSIQQSDISSTRSERADSISSIKPLPFVRPADIWNRRMQEEREKQRRSEDSSRSSVDATRNDQPAMPENQAQGVDRTSDRPITSQTRETSTSQTGNDVAAHQNVPALDPITEQSPRGSPLLPDVSRMSGFGESFLGSTSLDNPISDMAAVSQETSAKDGTQDATTSDLQYRNSLGFRSVVHQAFDRPEEGNLVSPTSASSSNIARTNSESTNAVSPIISRASSNAHAEARLREEAHRDASVPSITEEPGESPLRSNSYDAPSTPKGSRERSETQIYAPLPEQIQPPAFKPGHRRDMSTPSPDNSPARTPALETNNQTAEPQNAELATTTPVEPFDRKKFSDFGIPQSQQGAPRSNEAYSARANSPSKSKVRDIVGRLESPTREKPGVSGPNEKGRARPENSRLESFRPQLPGGWDSYSQSRPNEPTKSYKTLDKASIDEEDPFVHKSSSKVLEQQQHTPGTSPTETRNLSSVSRDQSKTMDPLSNLTAAGSALASALVSAVGMKEHPNSDSESESEYPTTTTRRSRANTELHPEASRLLPPNPSDSPVSSVAPTPLAKDTPMETPATGHPDYFPPVVPLKQKPRGSVSPENDTHNRIHPAILPSLSTENSPCDYESDRLRKELVRELSPSSGQFDRSRGSPPPIDSRPESTQMRGQNPGHDSMGLPQEYDSYWNDSNSNEPSSRPISNNHPIVSEPTSADYSDGNKVNAHHARNDRDFTLPSSNRLQVQQPELTHRFSWEELPEEISTSREVSAEPTLPTRVDSNTKDLPPPPRPESYDSSASLTSFGSGLAAAKLATTSDNDSPLSERFSQPLAKTNTNLATPPATDSNQSVSALQQEPAIRDGSDERGRGVSSSIPNSIPNAQPPITSDPGKIVAFREIMAMKSSEERVQAFNQTRQQFAAMNTGLSSWIASTLSDFPEHSDLLKNGGRFAVDGQKPTPPRGKLGGLRISHPQNQQPYYQQYMDASNLSPTSSATPSKQGQNSSPIYTPASSGTKLTTRQVQAKGKDLLHGAGVFGGKANVVAKGLFSKGKSKLRGSDKVDS